MTLMTLHALAKRFGDRVLFEDVAFTINDGERVGVVGVNGCGKSTLLRMFAGTEPMDSGTLALRRGARVGYLSQEPQFDSRNTIREEAATALAAHQKALDAHARVSEALATGEGDQDVLLAELETLTAEIEHGGGWDLNHRVEAILTPLGLTDLERSVEGLSGGEQKRLALGKVLLESPELLLLDEPTNHLDADTVLWLESMLPTYPGAVILITHDRLFLDRVVTRIIEVAEGGIIGYRGSYEAYLEGKANRLELAQRRKDRRVGLLRTELEWLRRGPKARGTKAQARIDRVHNMMETKEVTEDLSADLFFAKPDRLGKTILEAKGITHSIAGRTLIRDFSLKVKRGERLGIIGPNGSGKTTLLRILMGKLKPDQGEVVQGLNTQVAYFDQMRGDLDENKTVMQTLTRGNDWVVIGDDKVHVVSYLNRFLFPSDTHRMPVGMLSGGERNRLILAKLMAAGANVIVLDEPTNDLDLLTLQSLEAALVSFPGCVLVVTHDRSFLNKVATSILSFEGGGEVLTYVGNYDTYRALRGKKEAEVKAKQSIAQAAAKEEAQAARRQHKAKARRLSYKEKKELEALPERIEALEAEKAQVETGLGDPALYQGGGDAASTLTQRLGELEAELLAAYDRWESLESIAEASA